MTDDEEDKPTVVLDLEALKKQKLKREEDLSLFNQDLEFSVGPETGSSAADKKIIPDPSAKGEVPSFPIILFDFQSDFFQKEAPNLPKDLNFYVVKDLVGLNKFLGEKKFQIVILNYDASPKAVNQLTTQIRQKFPHAKTLIIAKNISPEKAKVHAKTASGADGYYQLPFQHEGLRNEIKKIHLQSVKKK